MCMTVILAGLLVGGSVYMLNNVVTALGANQTLPVMLAAWATPLAALAAGNAALLHRVEDGQGWAH